MLAIAALVDRVPAALHPRGSHRHQHDHADPRDTATQIAEAVEFLGGSINSGAGWNSSFVSLTVTSDKVEQAMAILADVVINPAFDQKELDLLKAQTLDGLTYNLKQPSFLANYAASKYSFYEHPAGGTPSSIASITTADVRSFHADEYVPASSVLIFTGDISLASASRVVSKGVWRVEGRGDTYTDRTRPMGRSANGSTSKADPGDRPSKVGPGRGWIL